MSDLPENDKTDLDVNVMEWLSDQQTERYTRILEQIESAHTAMETAQKEWAEHDRKMGKATTDMHPAKLKAFDAIGEWEWAVNARINMIKEITRIMGRNVDAWDALAQMAITVIDELVDGGKLPSNSGGAREYWRLVYGRILAQWSHELKTEPIFRHIRIVEFLTEMLVNRLPQFAEEARGEGKVMLAQALEELARK